MKMNTEIEKSPAIDRTHQALVAALGCVAALLFVALKLDSIYDWCRGVKHGDNKDREGIPLYYKASASEAEGRVLYSRGEHQPVGTVRELAPSHPFDDGSVRAGVKVQFGDGAERWVPAEAMAKMYEVQAR